jgi:hypothetical protein
VEHGLSVSESRGSDCGGDKYGRGRQIANGGGRVWTLRRTVSGTLQTVTRECAQRLTKSLICGCQP